MPARGLSFVLLLGVMTGTRHRSLLRRVEVARSRLLEPDRAVPNVSNEITVACSSWSFTARPLSLARGAEAPEVAVVRAQGHMHSQQTALPQRKSRGPVRTALETFFFLPTVRFSRKITTPPQSIGATGTHT